MEESCRNSGENVENRSSKRKFLMICRPGFETDLGEELSRSMGGISLPGLTTGPGWLACDLPGEPSAKAALIFERQRLPGAFWMDVPRGDALRMADLGSAVQGLLESGRAPWCLHAFTPDPQSNPGHTARVEAMGRDLVAGLQTAHAELAQRFVPAGEPLPAHGQVVQLCLVEGGVWVSAAPLSRLTSDAPGGVHPIAGDPLAPSRSYLKLEEAFRVLERQPTLRERVIDLGAAPGGWSYACLKRGCHVLAVDNGPMKIKGLEDLPGLLEHRKANGLSFRPAAGWVPTDWLISDMLVPPGETLGLLRRWLEGGWMRRFVVNIKLPQRHPLEALKPVETFLAGWPGLRYRMVQLYHDRREVTVTGELTTLPPAREATKKPREAGMKTHPRGAKSKKPTRRPPKQPGKKPVQPAARRRKRR